MSYGNESYRVMCLTGNHLTRRDFRCESLEGAEECAYAMSFEPSVTEILIVYTDPVTGKVTETIYDK